MQKFLKYILDLTPMSQDLYSYLISGWKKVMFCKKCEKLFLCQGNEGSYKWDAKRTGQAIERQSYTLISETDTSLSFLLAQSWSSLQSI